MSDINFGARLVGPRLTEFRFWAPDCKNVELIISEKAVPMSSDRNGLFACDAECGAGTEYMFQLDNGQRVPDPASRLQAGDVHGFSVVVDNHFEWRNSTWRGRAWAETVIYELHVGLFGGFVGVERELNRLANLGISAIELMPIADFSGRRNWGYDGVLPYAPDTAYGTPNELKSMIDTAHGLGLQVFLDVVYNHFGPEGNYLHSFAKSFFRSDIQTPWGDSIDFSNAYVRRFFIENALFWVNEYCFDGLRFDAVHAIPDKTFLLEMAAEIRKRTAGRHVHLMLENEKNEADLIRALPDEKSFDAQWTDDWHHCIHVLLTGETEGYYGDFLNPASRLARCLEQGFAYQGEPSEHANGEPRGTSSAHLPVTAFVICLQNHDQVGNRALGERLTTLAASDALRAATSLLLLTPQIPMLFMGEEIGETNPFLFFTDFHDELADAVREGRRKEFMKFKAFSDPETRKRIPDPNHPNTFATSLCRFSDELSTERKKILELHQHLLFLRTKHIIPRLEGAVSLGAYALNDKAVRAAWRMGDGSRLVIACNFGRDELSCPDGEGTLVFQSEPSLRKHTLPAFCTVAWLADP